MIWPSLPQTKTMKMQKVTQNQNHNWICKSMASQNECSKKSKIMYFTNNKIRNTQNRINYWDENLMLKNWNGKFILET